MCDNDYIKFMHYIRCCKDNHLIPETILKTLLNRAYGVPKYVLPGIRNVYFNDPVTVVLWNDGTKTIVRCQDGDTYSKETGLALCIFKKALGNKGNFNDIFNKWVRED